MSQLTIEALQALGKFAKHKSKVFVVQIDDLHMILRAIKQSGFSVKRGRSVSGVKNNTYIVHQDGYKMHSVWVDTFRTGTPGEILEMDEPDWSAVPFRIGH